MSFVASDKHIMKESCCTITKKKLFNSISDGENYFWSLTRFANRYRHNLTASLHYFLLIVLFCRCQRTLSFRSSIDRDSQADFLCPNPEKFHSSLSSGNRSTQDRLRTFFLYLFELLDFTFHWTFSLLENILKHWTSD